MNLIEFNGVKIVDTFAEAFPMKVVRVIITAQNLNWALNAAFSMTGFATSVIACGCEAAIESELKSSETPDDRPGISVLVFSMSGKELAKQIETRVGQCILTCPTTSVFNGFESGENINLLKNLRFFGDGWQISKFIDNKRYWRIPTMDGEFFGEETLKLLKGIGGGNLLILAKDTESALKIAEVGVKAIKNVRNVITPFPGGVVRSGSKVGSKYKTLPASTNTSFCPSLRNLVDSSLLSSNVGSVLEIVIDGVSERDIFLAMQTSMSAMLDLGRNSGLICISAGNYGGKLGPYHFHLKKIFQEIQVGK
ncbi:MAG: formylmethanofuran--tetrahydromethanopterin N-formyltransferase [Betaproteobacteria bacterium TMED156]|nr:MAG: formylmethanofuran--tetrahydromethanopterin N-formyltransferase [Betaproteobacteria bacterium TMED156]